MLYKQFEHSLCTGTFMSPQNSIWVESLLSKTKMIVV